MVDIMVVNSLMLLSNPYEPDVRVYKEISSLLRNGISVYLIAWDRECKYKKIEYFHNFTIFRFQKKGKYGKGVNSSFNFLRYYLFVLIKSIKMNINVIHCHDLDTLPIGFIVAKIKRIKIIYDSHEYEYFTEFHKSLRKIFTNIEKFITKKVDKVFVTNEIQLIKFINIQSIKNKVIEIRNCPESHFFFNQSKIRKLSNITRIGWIGYIQSKTGIENLIAESFKLQKIDNQLEIYFVGKIHNQYVEEFESLVLHLKNVHVFNAIEYKYVKIYYKKLHIAFMLYENIPKYRYNTPTKLYEAMARGIPIIATPIGDVQHIIEENKCGIIVDCNDNVALKKALISLVHNPTICQKLGNNGYNAARKSYTWEIMEKRLVDSYKELYHG